MVTKLSWWEVAEHIAYYNVTMRERVHGEFVELQLLEDGEPTIFIKASDIVAIECGRGCTRHESTIYLANGTRFEVRGRGEYISDIMEYYATKDTKLSGLSKWYQHAQENSGLWSCS